MRWRTGDKEIKKSRFIQSISEIICAEQPERQEQPHKLLPLHEAPTGRNNQSMRVNKPFFLSRNTKKQGGSGRLFRGPRKVY